MKTSSLVLASCFLIFNSARADEDVDDSRQPPVATDQSSNPAPAQSSLPLRAPQQKQPHDYMLMVTGDYLYLQAKEELPYGTTSVISGGVSTPTANRKARVDRIGPKYHSGSRIGLSYLLPKSKGDLSAKWMHYGGSHDGSASAPAGGAIWPDWLEENFAPFAQQAKARWGVELHVLDLQYGMAFKQKNILTLKPFAGFRAAWFDQHLTVNYKNVAFLGGPATIASIVSKNHSDSQGYGVCAGVESQWSIWRGFSLFANGAGSLLWSSFKNSQKEINSGGTLRSSLSDKITTTIPVLELIAGLAWDYEWETVAIGLRFGWEGQIWIHQSQLNRYLNTASHGGTRTTDNNFNLTGYNLRASLRF